VAEQLELIGQLRARARRSLAGRIDRERSWLAAARSRPALASPLLEIDRRDERIMALTDRARRSVAAGLTRARDDLSHTRARLVALSPASTMRRGYAIVQRPDGLVVREAAGLEPGQPLRVRFTDAQVGVTVTEAAPTDPVTQRAGPVTVPAYRVGP
jgi:exodeoxyribonuclease VII large subunit